jgi:excinuclease UvrABC nuclease subunit
MESEMREAAANLDFELAASLRDRMLDLQAEEAAAVAGAPARAGTAGRPGRRRGKRR